MNSILVKIIIFSVIVAILDFIYFSYTKQNISDYFITVIFVIVLYSITLSAIEYATSEDFSNSTTKIFGIGLFKTGTSSLGDALNQLGYKSSPDFVKLGIPENIFRNT